MKRSIEEVARKVNRTPKAIRNMVKRNNLSLREIRWNLFSVENLAIALRVRKAAFVPSQRGLVPRERSVLATNSSQAEYFELELSESLPETHPDTYMVPAAVYCPRTRTFLSLAHVTSLKADSLLDLIEHAAKSKSRSVEWWLCAYRRLSIDPTVSGYQRDQLVRRFLVPGGAGLLAVPANNDAQLCLRRFALATPRSRRYSRQCSRSSIPNWHSN